MDLDEYQRKAAQTYSPGPNETFNRMYLSLGLAGETGEVIEKIKKVVRNDNGVVSDEKLNGIRGELGDVLWYLSQLSKAFELSLNDIAEQNLRKLADRFERGVLKSEGDER